MERRLMAALVAVAAALGACTGAAMEDAGRSGTNTLRVWVPRSMALGAFLAEVAAEFESDTGIDVQIVEADVAPDAVEEALSSGDIDVPADLAVVPGGVGARLTGAGHLTAPMAALFEPMDAGVAGLPVLMAALAPTADVAAASTAERESAGDVWLAGCRIEADLTAAAAAIRSAPAPVPVGDGAGPPEDPTADLVDYAEAAAASLLPGATADLFAGLAAKYGSLTAGRVLLANAVPFINVASFLLDVTALVEATVELTAQEQLRLEELGELVDGNLTGLHRTRRDLDALLGAVARCDVGVDAGRDQLAQLHEELTIRAEALESVVEDLQEVADPQSVQHIDLGATGGAEEMAAYVEGLHEWLDGFLDSTDELEHAVETALMDKEASERLLRIEPIHATAGDAFTEYTFEVPDENPEPGVEVLATDWSWSTPLCGSVEEGPFSLRWDHRQFSVVIDGFGQDGNATASDGDGCPHDQHRNHEDVTITLTVDATIFHEPGSPDGATSRHRITCTYTGAATGSGSPCTVGGLGDD